VSSTGRHPKDRNRSRHPQLFTDQSTKTAGVSVSDPAVRAALVKHGGKPMRMTQPDFARFVLGERESAARIIEAAGIKPL